MPYIKTDRRIGLVMGDVPTTAGELNFLFTTYILSYLKSKGESYQTYNDIVGALENCKQELYRRKIAPYESEKINENGDVF